MSKLEKQWQLIREAYEENFQSNDNASAEFALAMLLQNFSNVYCNIAKANTQGITSSTHWFVPYSLVRRVVYDTLAASVALVGSLEFLETAIEIPAEKLENEHAFNMARRTLRSLLDIMQTCLRFRSYSEEDIEHINNSHRQALIHALLCAQSITGENWVTMARDGLSRFEQ